MDLKEKKFIGENKKLFTDIKTPTKYQSFSQLNIRATSSLHIRVRKSAI